MLCFESFQMSSLFTFHFIYADLNSTLLYFCEKGPQVMLLWIDQVISHSRCVESSEGESEQLENIRW